MHRRIPCLFAIVLAFATHGANAQGDKYQITAEEKAACTPDAMRLCSAAYPDEDKLMSCLKTNRASLSAQCAAVFKAGLKERGLR